MAGSDRNPIPVVISVDVEPDGPGHEVTAETPWDGVPATRRWLVDVLARTVGRSGREAHLSWLLRSSSTPGPTKHLREVAALQGPRVSLALT